MKLIFYFASNPHSFYLVQSIPLDSTKTVYLKLSNYYIIGHSLSPTNNTGNSKTNLVPMKGVKSKVAITLGHGKIEYGKIDIKFNDKILRCRVE